MTGDHAPEPPATGAPPGGDVEEGRDLERLLTSVAPDLERIAQGWTPRFVAGPDRAEEMMRLYQQLGFEVAADPIQARDMTRECRDCRLLIQLRFRYLYTRGGSSGGGADPTPERS